MFGEGVEVPRGRIPLGCLPSVDRSFARGYGRPILVVGAPVQGPSTPPVVVAEAIAGPGVVAGVYTREGGWGAGDGLTRGSGKGRELPWAGRSVRVTSAVAIQGVRCLWAG